MALLHCSGLAAIQQVIGEATGGGRGRSAGCCRRAWIARVPQLLILLVTARASAVHESSDPRGPGNALLCAQPGPDCWSAILPANSTSGPFLVLQRSAAAEAFKAARGVAANVTLVPSLAPIWAERPRAAGPLPPGAVWDLGPAGCTALLGCTDTRLERPPTFPDVARGAPAGLTAVIWVQGRAIHVRRAPAASETAGPCWQVSEP